jgi:hypothetical protein
MVVYSAQRFISSCYSLGARSSKSQNQFVHNSMIDAKNQSHIEGDQMRAWAVELTEAFQVVRAIVYIGLYLLYFVGTVWGQTPETLTNPNIVGSANLITTTGNGISFANDSPIANRIFQGQEPSVTGCSIPTDEILQLGYNRRFTLGNFVRDDSSKETAILDIESCYGGETEMNWDMYPASSNNSMRAMGEYARYDGTKMGIAFGLSPYAIGAGGAAIRGGTNLASTAILDLQECASNSGCGITKSSNYLRLLRQDGTVAMRIAMASDYAANSGSIIMAVDGSNVAGSGSGGSLTFDGIPHYPSVVFWQVGTPTDAFEKFYATGDTFERFSLLRNGTMQWGPGSGNPDTDLYRSDTSTLRTDGNLIVGGNLAVMGQKAALVQTATHGQRKVYAVESPDEWFEDFGDAKLAGSLAIVKIDPIFGETVNTNWKYHVFLTANGRCSLYVAEKTSSFFKVKRLNGARTCAFEYRIVAKRRGYESVRLAQVAIPYTPSTK